MNNQQRARSLPLFSMGQIVATPGALALLERHGIQASTLLSRHAEGDWGEIDAEDCRSNEDAVNNGSRIFSSYTVKGKRLFVITESCDERGTRASTCILKASEY